MEIDNELGNLFIYDGTCSICFKVALIISRINRDIRLCTSQDFSHIYTDLLSRRDFDENAVFLDQSGIVHKGYLAILEAVGLKKSKFHLLYLILNSHFMRLFGKFFYRMFANNRHHLQCGLQCSTQNQP
jgi:predicted DCC family thiol-disulfide oxidoreductase YuxK